MVNSQTNTAPTIEFCNLTLAYTIGKPVVQNLNGTLSGAGIVHLADSNGKGKSTFVEGLSGYLKPIAGNVHICGHEAHRAEARNFRAVCRTQPALHPNVSIRDHCAIIAKLHGIDRQFLEKRAQLLGLSPYVGERTSSLSTGTAKKLWYLLCTAMQKPIMIFDEPFNAVDLKSVALMTKEIREWSKESLVLLVTHMLPEGFQDATEKTLDDFLL